MISGGNTIALMTGGVLTEVPEVSAPAISAVASDNSIAVAVYGESGAVNFVKYKSGGDVDWLSGGSITGDGTVVISGLNYNATYILTAYSELNGVFSPPAAACIVVLSQASSDDNSFDAAVQNSTDIALEVFGEQIIYVPAGGGSRNILAIIDREGIDALPGIAAVNAPVKYITVANDTTEGISSSEFNAGGDMAIIDDKSRKLVKITSEDAGMITIEVR
jgi:hypothetical protein